MTNLSEWEQLAFAHFAANGAQDVKMDPKFCPYGELVVLMEDKIRFGTRPFGANASSTCANVAREFLDLLIEREGFATFKNDLGAMYRYQGENYRKCIKDLQDSNPIVLKAQAAGPGYWVEAFAALNNSATPPPSD